MSDTITTIHIELHTREHLGDHDREVSIPIVVDNEMMQVVVDIIAEVTDKHGSWYAVHQPHRLAKGDWITIRWSRSNDD